MSIVRGLRVLDGENEERTTDELVEESVEYWEDNLDCELKGFHIRELISWYCIGFEHDLIKACMMETFRAPAPAWRYLSAIIRRLTEEKVYSLEGFRKRGAQRRKKSEESGKDGGARVKRVMAQMYTQREIDGEGITKDSVRKILEGIEGGEG